MVVNVEQEALISMLQTAPNSSMLYSALGNLLEKENPKQAFLCYQNAKFYAQTEAEKQGYQQHLDRLAALGHKVPPVSFIILNYNKKEITNDCLRSIRQFNAPETYELVVVDNNSTDGSKAWLKTQPDVVLVDNHTNHGFAGGCNDGIKQANPQNDIFLLNNDTIMMPNALFTLRMNLYEDKKTGAVGCMTNFAANGQAISSSQSPKDLAGYLKLAATINVPNPRSHELKTYLVGFAELIRRDVLEKVGFLDEQFNPGNYEDNDLGYRILKAGYNNILCHDCLIVHLGSQSFRGNPAKEEAYKKLLLTNLNKINTKYQFDIERYTHSKPKWLDFILFKPETPLNILFLGCKAGAFVDKLNYLYPNSTFDLYESNPQMAALVSPNFHVHVANYDHLKLNHAPESLDLVILDECLAQCSNSQKLLAQLTPLLKRDGMFFAVIKKDTLQLDVLKDEFKANNLLIIKEQNFPDEDLFTLQKA